MDNEWPIPVAGCDEVGMPNGASNLGPSIARRGLMAPSIRITSTFPGGKYYELSGTSISAAFVTGSIALLWSEFPNVTAGQIKNSITRHRHTTRRTVVPKILNVSETRKYLKSILLNQTEL